MILLDTDVVSALRRPDRADMNLVRWASRTPVSELYLSVVTILELEVGVLQLERRDVAQGSVLRTWLEKQILARFDGRILAFDLQAAVATCNVGDFAPTGVELINPWVASS